MVQDRDMGDRLDRPAALIGDRVIKRSRDMGATAGEEVCIALEGDVTRERAEEFVDADMRRRPA